MSYNGSTKTFDKIADLKLQKAAPNVRVNVLGYNEVNDGGDGSFYWDDISVEPDNGGTIFEVQGELNGRWKRIILNNTINVKHFGAKGDGVNDDTVALQNSLTVAKNIGASLFIPKTENFYLVSTTIHNNGCNIISESATIKATTPTFHLLYIDSSNNIEINNINLEYQTPQPIAGSIGFCPVFVINSSNITFRNVHVLNGGSFYMQDSTNILLDGCSIIWANYQGYFFVRCTRSKIINSYAEKVVTGYRTEQCYDIEFVNNHAFDNWSDPVRIEDTQRCKVLGNTFRKCYGGMGVYGPHSGFAYDTRDTVFADNILEDCFYSETEIPNPPALMRPNIVKGAMNTKSHCDNTLFTNNLVRSNYNAETILIPTTENTVFTFPGWNTSEVRTDTSGNSNFLLTRYGNYIYAVDTDPVSESNRREGSWYYVNFDNPVDLNNTKFTIDFYIQTITLVPGVFEVRLYSGRDRADFIGSLPMYNAGIANCPLSVIFNTTGLEASSVSCIELYCVKDQITDPAALTPGLVAMSNIRKGLDQRIGFWHSNLNTQPTNVYFSNTNSFINVEIPILHKRVGSEINPIIYTDRVDDSGPQSNRPLNVPVGYRYFNTDTNKLEIKSSTIWTTWPDGNWSGWPNAPTLHEILTQGNSSFLPIILNNQSYRADGTNSNNGYGLYNAGIIKWLLGKTNNDFGIYRYDSSGSFLDRPFNISNTTGNVLIGASGSGISTLDVRGSLTLSVATISSATTLDNTHLTVRCSTTSGSYNVTLPAASTCFGRIHVLKKVTSDINTVTIVPVEQIDGQSNFVLRALNDTIILQSTGSFWNVLSNNLSPVLTTKTTNYTATYFDSTILVDSTAGNVTITLPTTNIPIGKMYVIKKMVAANTVTIDPQSSATIDGGSSISLTTQYASKQPQFDGTNYVVLNS